MLQFGIIVLLCTGVMTQSPTFGSCPKVKAVQDFDVSKFTGLWYEYSRYFAIFEVGAKCITANYSLNSDGSLKVYNQMKFITGNLLTIEGTATLSGKKTEGKLTVSISAAPIKVPASYWILGTDYENYAVAYSCADLPFFHTKLIWVLTRKQEPPTEALDQVKEIFKKNNLSQDPLKKTNQKNCS